MKGHFVARTGVSAHKNAAIDYMAEDWDAWMLYILRDSRRSITAIAAGSLIAPLISCEAPLVAGVPDIVITEVAPRAINGKGLVEDGVDAATGKDCRVIEGMTRNNRKICETRDSPATKKDFKGLEGIGNDPALGEKH